MKIVGNRTVALGVSAILGAASAYLAGEIGLESAIQLGLTGLISIFLRKGIKSSTE